MCDADDAPLQQPGATRVFTRLLARAAEGDRVAAADLLPLVYDQLRAAAQQAMRHERPGHTLSATALVHEAYARLLGAQGQQQGVAAESVPLFAGQAHFFAAAAQAMRQHLIDHARAKLAAKRGGAGRVGAAGDEGATPAARRVQIEHLREVADLAMTERPEEILSLDAALCRLETEHPEPAAVVRLRFYAGLSIEQSALTLGVSVSTVKRDWQFARAWLYRMMVEARQ